MLCQVAGLKCSSCNENGLVPCMGCKFEQHKAYLEQGLGRRLNAEASNMDHVL
jgi:hypothetical protein